MVNVHRNGDQRACGAATVVTGQNFVDVEGELWAVAGDPDSHGGGGLIPGTISFIDIGGLQVIGVGDTANPDSACSNNNIHCHPSATTGDANVTAE